MRGFWFLNTGFLIIQSKFIYSKPSFRGYGSWGAGAGPNLRRFVMPKLLLIELLKHIPSYYSGPLLVFCYHAHIHKQPFVL